MKNAMQLSEEFYDLSKEHCSKYGNSIGFIELLKNNGQKVDYYFDLKLHFHILRRIEKINGNMDDLFWMRKREDWHTFSLLIISLAENEKNFSEIIFLCRDKYEYIFSVLFDIIFQRYCEIPKTEILLLPRYHIKDFRHLTLLSILKWLRCQVAKA